MSTIVAFLLLSLVLSDSGCATFDVQQGYHLESSRGAGVLAVGFTFDESGHQGSWRYRRIDVPQKGDINFWTYQDPITWQHPFGRLAIVELEAGEYEFFDWGESDVEAQAYFSVPFSIRPGRVTYIGRLHLIMDRAAGTYHLEPVDALEADRPIIMERIAGLTPDRIDQVQACICPCRGSQCIKPSRWPLAPLMIIPRTSRLARVP